MSTTSMSSPVISRSFFVGACLLALGSLTARTVLALESSPARATLADGPVAASGSIACEDPIATAPPDVGLGLDAFAGVELGGHQLGLVNVAPRAKGWTGLRVL